MPVGLFRKRIHFLQPPGVVDATLIIEQLVAELDQALERSQILPL
jgi:hypothetical protein